MATSIDVIAVPGIIPPLDGYSASPYADSGEPITFTTGHPDLDTPILFEDIAPGQTFWIVLERGGTLNALRYWIMRPGGVAKPFKHWNGHGDTATNAAWNHLHGPGFAGTFILNDVTIFDRAVTGTFDGAFGYLGSVLFAEPFFAVGRGIRGHTEENSLSYMPTNLQL